MAKTAKIVKTAQVVQAEVKEVALSEKQLASITQIQAQKQILKNQFDELSSRENTLLELILEFANIPVPVEELSLKDGKLLVKVKK